MSTAGRSSRLIPRNRYFALGAVLVLLVCLFQLAINYGVPLGVGPGPSVSSFFSTARVVSLMSSFGYIGLFALMVLESASLPIPSEVVLPFAGYMAFLGAINLGAALVVSTAAALLGALVDYFLALKLGEVFVERFIRRVGMDHGSLGTAEDWFRTRGAWTVFAARFVPLVRSVISLPAGLFRMPLWSFVLFTTLGCVVWNAVLIYAGLAAGILWESVVGSSFALFVNVVLAVFAGIAALYLVYYAYERATA